MSTGKPDWSAKSKKRGPRAVGAFLPDIVGRVVARFGFPGPDLLTEWPTIVGADLASFTSPERIRWPHRPDRMDPPEEGSPVGAPGTRNAGATLIVRVAGPRAIEVQHHAPRIIERINAYFGYRAVATLRLLQAPIAASPRPPPRRPRADGPNLEPNLDGIVDERLQTALRRLANNAR